MMSQDSITEKKGSCNRSAGGDMCGSPLLKEENHHYTFRTIPREHWSIGMSMARPS